MIGKDIEDTRFLKLLKDMLEAGYMEDWKYNRTYSGTPQGGIISPLLSNIILHELDTFVEDVLIPKYTKGEIRKRNPEYERWRQKAIGARRRGDWKTHKMARKVQKSLPVFIHTDPGFCRLWYVRYADDFLLGLIGTKEQAEKIKEEIKQFLKRIELELSEEKTLITHAKTEKARFLNYEISTIWEDSQKKRVSGVKRRHKNGGISLTVPNEVVKKWINKVKKDRKTVQIFGLQNNSDYDIVATYEAKVQGLINYYTMAHDVYVKMARVRYTYEQSLVKTLAGKHKTKVTHIYRNYSMWTADGRRVIAVNVPRKDKKPLHVSYGAKPIRQNRNVRIRDDIQHLTNTGHNEIVTRLLAEVCEVCGDTEDVTAHHIRKLKDLKKKYQGRKKQPPEWAKKMIAMNRKTIFVCRKCHNDIHSGRYDGAKLASS